MDVTGVKEFPKYIKTLSEEDQIAIIQNVNTILTDCDGVIWLWNKPIEGAIDVVNKFQGNNKNNKVYFISNNSTKTVSQYMDKFGQLGFKTQKENIIVTASLTAQYLNKNFDKSKSVYVVGSPAITTELSSVGIKTLVEQNNVSNESVAEGEAELDISPDVGAVVVGFDLNISYVKLTKAATYLNKNKDCLLIGTNRDAVFPVADTNYVLPATFNYAASGKSFSQCSGLGRELLANCLYDINSSHIVQDIRTGAIVKAIETCSGREATIIGKPETIAQKYLQEQYSVCPKAAIMIGDRCDSDILFGNRCGFTTILVLTGVHSIEDVKRFYNSDQKDENDSVPDYYTDSIADLLPLITALAEKL